MDNVGKALDDGNAFLNWPHQTEEGQNFDAEAHLVLAQAYALLEHWKESADHAEEALSIATSCGYPEGRITTIQAILDEARGRLHR